MSPEEQTMYDEYFDLFARDGWKRLEEDMEANIRAIESIHNIKDLESLWVAKGKLEAFGQVANLKSTIEMMYEDSRSPHVHAAV
jgi:hypothetical protein